MPLEAGEVFGWLGRPYRLRLTGDGPDARFARDEDGRWVELRHDCGVAAIAGLYAREGLSWLAGSPAASRIRVNAMRAGADNCRFEVRDLGGRPARCFPSRGLAVLHWAVFSLEPRLVEYQASAMLAHAGLGHTRRTRQWQKNRRPPVAGPADRRRVQSRLGAGMDRLRIRAGQASRGRVTFAGHHAGLPSARQAAQAGIGNWRGCVRAGGG